MAATTNDTIAVRVDGSVLAWGSNNAVTNVPPNAANVISVVAGNEHVLALRADGSLASWGSTAFGKTTIPSNATNIVSITAVEDFSAALRADGRVFVWGSYWNIFQYEPVSFPPTITDVIDIAGRYVLLRDGTVVDWIAEVTVPSISDIVTIANQVGVRSNTTVAVWGPGRNGANNLPPGLSNVVSVAAGVDHRLAVGNNGSLVAWGANNMGQTNIPIGLKAIKAAGGLVHSLAIATPDSVMPGRFQFAGTGVVRPRETSGHVQLTVERVGGSSGPATVKISTINGSASPAKISSKPPAQFLHP